MDISRFPTKHGSAASQHCADGSVPFTAGKAAWIALPFRSPQPTGCGCDDECAPAIGFARGRGQLSPEEGPGRRAADTASTRPMRPRRWRRVLTSRSAPDPCAPPEVAAAVVVCAAQVPFHAFRETALTAPQTASQVQTAWAPVFRVCSYLAFRC